MPRMTKAADGVYTVDESRIVRTQGGYAGGAVDRLGRFEDFLDLTASDLDRAAAELERLRAQGREKSARFRECLARKLTAGHILDLLEARGLR